MDDRKKLILETIIQEYLETVTPVASGVLVDKYKLNISPATVRNEMNSLESEGYIMQPHTSAGRIPTELAYHLHLNSLKPKKLKNSEINLLKKAWQSDSELKHKNLAKVLAGLSNGAVFWAIHKRDFYYTGISNFLTQPEFVQTDLIYNISSIIDKMDEIIEGIFDNIKDKEVLIGRNNPFSPLCSSFIAKYREKDGIGLFGLLSPLRVDYSKNLALVDFVLELIKK